MNEPANKISRNLPPGEVFSPEQLRTLAARIKDSGELGRSRVYASLLDYLVQCSIDGRQPKEIEIAMEVLGRQTDFDVSRDSAVRVYIHQLRKKLDAYYRQQKCEDPYRIVIPKGQYTIAAVPQKLQPSPVPAKPGLSFNFNTALLASIALLLAANLWFLIGERNTANSTALNHVAPHQVWQPLLDDEIPILLVMGDYYIFGELNANGNVARMIREFDVNSSRDLESKIFSDIEATENYLDLDLSYMPEGSAYALVKIAPLLQSTGKRVSITMMSDLTIQDIRSNHIVYIGYLSALDKLSTMAFAASGLRIGRSYDELLNLETGVYYTSDAGLPESGAQFRDYGMFSTFPASSETQLVVVAGMRDAGLMHTAMAVSDETLQTQLDQILGTGMDPQHVSFEALYEVFGVDRMNFSANLIYSNHTDPSYIWGNQISSFAN
ncbi:MAG: hypothetical protein WD772_05290 [Pseudohongiellaceae bacterium]